MDPIEFCEVVITGTIDDHSQVASIFNKKTICVVDGSNEQGQPTGNLRSVCDIEFNNDM